MARKAWSELLTNTEDIEMQNIFGARWGDMTIIDTVRQFLLEIKRLREKTAMTLGVGDGTGKLFVHGDYESIKATQKLIFELEMWRHTAALTVKQRELYNLIKSGPKLTNAQLADRRGVRVGTLEKQKRALREKGVL